MNEELWLWLHSYALLDYGARVKQEDVKIKKVCKKRTRSLNEFCGLGGKSGLKFVEGCLGCFIFWEDSFGFNEDGS